MRTLQRPRLDAEKVYRACISRVESAELKVRLEGIAPVLVQAASDYDAAGRAGTLASVQPHDRVGDVTRAELVAVYTGRMAHQDSPGRGYYDVILSAPKHRICPSCAHRTVSTLDHYLPKATFPSLAVAPDNLVPSCKDCNLSKSSKATGKDTEQFIHPYYDPVGHGRWLFASVVEGSPAAVTFYVDPPADWDSALRGRLVYHFEHLAINELYVTQAAVEMGRHHGRLQGLFDLGGAAAVRIHLEEEARTSERANVNSWPSATFSALASSDWYCEGGFNEIDE